MTPDPASTPLREALRLAQPIVEADHHAAIDAGDGDWEGASYVALEAVNAALASQPALPSLDEAEVACPTCKGVGDIDDGDHPCMVCGGTGKRPSWLRPSPLSSAQSDAGQREALDGIDYAKAVLTRVFEKRGRLRDGVLASNVNMAAHRLAVGRAALLSPVAPLASDEREAGWPEKLTPELRALLGLMCFQLAGPAHVYQKAGLFFGEEGDLWKRAENEQAFMLHKLIGFWFANPAGWADAAQADLNAARAALGPDAKKGEG